MKSILFSLDGRKDLAESIIAQANQWSIDNQVTLGDLNKQKFSDGELCVDFTDSVRGKRVYILCSPNTSDEIMKIMLTIDAAKRAAAKEIIPILPYFPYARQDKKDQSRGPIGAKVIATMLESVGVTSVITFDLHADQIQGFFEIPVTHLEGKNVFADHINKNITSDTILCGPDAGSGKRVKRMKEKLAKHYGVFLNYVMLDKTRKSANVIDEMVIIGDVKGKDVIILDDMVDTFGSADKAIDALINNGAKSVKMIASHGILSGQAYERLGDSKLSELIISDSLMLVDPLEVCVNNFSEEICLKIMKGFNKIKVVSLSKSIGLAMAAMNNNISYESILGTKE